MFQLPETTPCPSPFSFITFKIRHCNFYVSILFCSLSLYRAICLVLIVLDSGPEECQTCIQARYSTAVRLQASLSVCIVDVLRP